MPRTEQPQHRPASRSARDVWGARGSNRCETKTVPASRRTHDEEVAWMGVDDKLHDKGEEFED
jgi:hypothetical protein